MELLPIEVPTLVDAGWTPERKMRFLSLLAESGNVRAGAQTCGLSAQSVYKLRRRDALFARAWNAAILLARDHSEQVLANRALEGVEEPIYYKGELVGTRRRYDTRLLLAHIARLDLQAKAVDHADVARFDELLALVAGERNPEGMAGQDPHLRQSCDAYAAAQATAARRVKDKQLPRGRTKGGDAERKAAIEAAGRMAREAARTEWSAWSDRACIVVDRIDGLHLRTLTTVSTAALLAGQGTTCDVGPQPFNTLA